MHALKGNPRRGLIGATTGFFFGFAAVALFGPTAGRLASAMDLSPLQVGFLVAMPSLSGSLLRLPFSAWVESSGGRKPFLVLLLTSLTGMIALTAIIGALYPDGMTPGLYPLLLLLGALCGCGIATFSVGICQVAYWFPQERQGWAAGVYAGLGNIAPGLFSFFIPIALIKWGLAGSYYAWLAFLALGALLYYFLGGNAWYFQLRHQGLDAAAAREAAARAGQEIFPGGTPLQSLIDSSRNRSTWMLMLIYFTSFGGFLAMTAWLPTYWKSLHGSGDALAGLLTGGFAILASLVRVGGGAWADRYGGRRTALASLAVLLAGALLMTVASGFAVAVTAEVAMALGMGVCNAAVFKLVPQLVPGAVGGASGWVGGLGAFGGFVLPPLLGVFVERLGNEGYVRGFAVFAALAVISLVTAFSLDRGRASG